MEDTLHHQTQSDIMDEKKENKKLESLPCEVCGGKYIIYNKSKHFKTKKHLRACGEEKK